ncbi:hypothetical protein PspLS_04704 [Pyricularia sp. CBS 133598]|nr:hypothetical protein PspLS_04704 [Pyricularia sp. CBS 133598]
MKLQTSAAANIIIPRALASQQIRPLITSRRCYATNTSANDSSATQRRRAVTPFNDDGRVPWTELSGGEKTSRAVQQTFNFGMVLVGMALTGGIGYLLYSEVFSPDSKVAYYNRAVDRIRKDPRCLELLGDSKSITAFGEETSNKWRRARPIASTLRKDAQGNEHMMIHFNLEGSKGRGMANMHLIKRVGGEDFEYRYFYVDVVGHQRIYLENSEALGRDGSGKKTIFGIRFS